MKRSERPEAKKRAHLSIAGHRCRSEAGDTLVEVLITVVVLGLASVALMTAFGTSISASSDHRNLSTFDTVLASVSQEAIASIQSQVKLFNTCEPLSYYQANVPLSTGNVQYSVAFATTNPILYWDKTNSSYDSNCAGSLSQSQLITLTVKNTSTGQTYNNSFVVEYPVAITVSGASGSASQLVFLLPGVGSPTTPAGTSLETNPVVAVEDSSGNAVSTDLSPVTLSITAGSGPNGAVLAGCSGSPVLGVITFTGCNISLSGTYTLTASSPNLANSAPSNSIVISGSANKLVFTTEPTAGQSGTAFSPEPVIQEETSTGTFVDPGTPVTLTLVSSGGVLQGCTGLTSSTGTFTIAGCTFAGGYYYNSTSNQFLATPYVLIASATGLISATSSAFQVTSAGTAAKIVFSSEPDGAAGTGTTAFALQPAITAEDSFGNVATTYATSVTLSISGGQTLTCTGGNSLTPTNGIATFSGCAGSALANGLTLSASSGTGANQLTATSTSFNITGVPAKLIFTTQPVAGLSGAAFTSEPVITVEDTNGNVVTASLAQLSFSILPNDGVGLLSLCTNLTPVLGVVTVQNCTFAGTVGKSYTMTASSTSTSGTISATSLPFQPTGAGVATKLAFTTQPVAAAAGSNLATEPVVKIEDSAGNVATSSVAWVTLAASGGVFSCTSAVQAVSGVVNFPACTFGGLYTTPATTYFLTATSLGLLQATSSTFSVTGPGPASTLVLTGCPTSIDPTITCVLTGTVQDAFTNTVTSNASTITFIDSSGTGAVTGLTSLAAVNGVATDTVTGLTAGPVVVDATGDSFTSNTVTITVNPAPNITTTSLPGATKTGAYSQTVVGTGGVTPYVWSLSAGALPSGLTLNSSTGVISGTVPSGGASSSFTVKMVDAQGVSDTQPLTITVNAVPTITAATLATATDTQSAYSQTLATTGGTTPFTWTVSSGALPSGLSINATTGVISGAVGASATTQAFGVTLTDANGVTATQSFTINVNAAPNITTLTLPGATKTGTYSQTLVATGGTTPLAWSISTGILPAGLTINAATGVISGTVSISAVSETFVATVTDANGVSDTQSLTIIVNGAPSITTLTLPGATKTGTYSQTVAGTGGTTPYVWSISSGILPTGLAIAPSTGVISGTVNAGATTQTFTVKLTDADGVTATQSYTITVNAVPTISTTTLATATDTQTGYSQTLVGAGGTTPYVWTLTTGILPLGLTLSSGGVISGNVNASAVTEPFTVTLTDADGVIVTKALTITVNAVPNITTTTLPGVTKGTVYPSQTLTLTGGTSPFTWSSTGSLPPGITLSSAGVISGTAGTTTSTYSFTAIVTDSNGVSDTQVLSITVNAAPSVSTSTLAAATQTQTGYSQTLAGTGGTTPYTWTLTTGILPLGLTLSSGGVISGNVNASAVTEPFTVTLTDADGVTATKALSITVNTVPNVTTTTLPVATQGQTTYSQTLAASGGTTPFTWTKTGTLPTGLTLSSGGVISGSVGAGATSATFTVIATDTNGVSASQSLTLTVNAAPNITTTTMPDATESKAYGSHTLTLTGGTSPFTWSSTGTLPPGITLSSTGVISGNDSTTNGIYSFSAVVTDANNVSATQALTITVNAAPSVTTASLAGATQTEVGYSQTLTGSSGTTPYTWTETGTMPAGLTLSSAGVISGTVTATANTYSFTVTLTDAYGATATKSLSIVVKAAPSITTASPLATATDGQTTYSQTLAGTGGQTSYVWTLTSGTLPAGLNLSTGGVIDGTLSGTAATQTFTVTLTDANGAVVSKAFLITVAAAPNITTTTLPAADEGTTYANQTLTLTGGTSPFTWTSSGSLPPGITLSAAGVISGKDTTTHTSYTFNAIVTDAHGVSDTQSLTLVVNAAPSISTTSPLPEATQNQVGYSQTLVGAGGTLPYVWTISSGTLPSGLSLTGGVISGTLGATATSATVTFMLTDADGATITKALLITVAAAPNITTTSLPGGTHNTNYNQSQTQNLVATGGTGTLTWTLTTGSLPGGLNLSSGGVISGFIGNFDARTAYPFTVTVTDANGVTDTQNLSITVN